MEIWLRKKGPLQKTMLNDRPSTGTSDVLMDSYSVVLSIYGNFSFHSLMSCKFIILSIINVPKWDTSIMVENYNIYYGRTVGWVMMKYLIENIKNGPTLRINTTAIKDAKYRK